MSTPLILKFPEDTTGKAASNKVVGEPHETIQRRNRIIIPEYGAYYKDSLKVYDAVTGKRLPDKDFECVELSPTATKKSKKNVYSIIIITNQALTSNQWRIDYQAYGGDAAYSTSVIARMYNDVMNDDRPIAWGDIFGKDKEFVPTPHLSDIGDAFGFEYLVMALESIRQAILIGDSASHDAIYQYIDSKNGELALDIDALERRLEAHINDKNNPHGITKETIGLENIPNAITDRRDQNTNDILLTAKGMYDHTKSGDHDDRYMRREPGQPEIRFRWQAGKLFASEGSKWTQIYPARYV